MRVLTKKISPQELLGSAEVVFDGPMVKAVVDVKKELVGVDANMHADIEQFLLGQGSRQEDLWGINLYPEDEEDLVEFDSMINIRPRQGNRSRGVEDEEMREKILKVVGEWVG